MMVFFSVGFNASPKSLFLAAITEDLNIPRSLYSLNDSIRYLTRAIVEVFFGVLIMKFGARKLIACGFGCLICSALLYAFANGLAMFYLAGFFLGVGTAWTSTSVVGYIVENWFADNKGSVMGIILASSGLGSAFATQFFTKVIYINSRFTGWRLCYVLVAVFLCVVAIATFLVVRNHPKDMELEPMHAKKVKTKKIRVVQWDGVSFSEAKRKPYFYMCCAGIFLTGMVLQSIYSVSAAHMKDQGVNPDTIALVLSASALLLMLSKTGVGIIFDKLGLRLTLLICTSSAMVAILSLAFVSDVTTAFIYCICCAFALPLETVMLPLITKEVFGSHSFSKIMGIIVSVNTLGYATGVPLMNFTFDRLGSYTPAMIAMGIIMAITAIIMQFVITAAHKDRATIERKPTN